MAALLPVAVVEAAQLGAALFEELCAYLSAQYVLAQAQALEITAEIAGENIANVLEIYFLNGWRGFITEDVLQALLGLGGEDANLAAPMVRMIAAFGTNNYVAGLEVRLPSYISFLIDYFHLE